LTTHTTEYYTCDCCNKKTDVVFFGDIAIEIPDTIYSKLDFCSIECFIKFFNETMSAEHIDVRIKTEER
jgi:hypothetical protein